MSSNLITILIPCHNSEKLISKLFKILDNQTNQNFDVIFVDDCSIDNTKALLLDYCKIHTNYKVIVNLNNRGVAANRNLLINNVKTKYFMFLDDDDFLHPKAIEILLKEIQKNDTFEILTFSAGYRYEGKKFNITFRNNIPFFRTKFNKTIEHFICHNLITSWGHLFLTSFVKSSKHDFLPNYMVSEDFGTVIIWLLCCSKWRYISKTLIWYIFRKKRTNNVTRVNDSIEWIKKDYESNQHQLKHCLNGLPLIKDKYKSSKKLLNRVVTWFFLYLPPKKKWIKHQDVILPILDDMLYFVKSKGLKLGHPSGIAYKVLFSNIKKTINTTDSLKQYRDLIK